MSVEAVWIAKFGDVEEPTQLQNGGVVILDTQRLYGGDSAYAYIGNYILEGARLTGTVSIERHNPDPDFGDVWLTGEDGLTFQFDGKWDGDSIQAVMTGPGGLQVGLSLQRFRNLP